MESQARYVFVGIAVVVLSALIVIAILWLSEAGGRRNAQTYSVYFRKHALNGLQMNSDVTMRGIKVGSVADLHISPKNIEQVRVDIVVDSSAPVKSDTVAVINRNLLTGFAMIDLARGTQNSPLLDRVLPGEAHPVIPEGSSELEQIAETVPDLVDHLGQLASRVQALLSEENVKTVGLILNDVHDVTSVLAKDKHRIDSVLTKVEAAAEDISKVSHSLSGITAPGGKLDQVSDELIEGLRQTRELATNLNAGLSDLLASIRGTSQLLSQQVLSMSQSVTEGSKSLSATFQNYEEPRTLVGGPHPKALGPGER